LQATSLAVFLLATYGEGDPTDNAMTFAKWLQNEDGELSEQALGGLNYAVFGLGSTQYEHYNKMGKVAHKRLKELGASPVVDLGLGDELTVEEDFEKWSEGLWAPLSKAAGEMGRSDSVSIVEPPEVMTQQQEQLDFTLVLLPAKKGLLQRANSKIPTTASNGAGLVVKVDESKIQASTKFFFHNHQVAVVTNRELRTPKDGGSTRHVEVSLAGSGLSYTTADNLAVLPENPAKVVEAVAAGQGYDLDALFEMVCEKAKFPTPCTVREALTRYLDLCGIPRRTTLGQLATFALAGKEAERLKFLASKQGRDEYNQFVVKEGRSLAELITETFPSVRLPLQHFINLAPHLQPRYYTISSSSSVHPTHVHATVAVTKDEPRPGRVHLGVCSSYLAAPSTQHVRIFIRPSSFRLPAESITPIILIGPGTGIAPMRALLQERRHQRVVLGQEVGETLLYFGCRRRDTDFLYEEELMGFEKDGTLTDLQLAFSREKAEKVYVQHLLAQGGNATKLWELVAEKGAHIYVCGGTSMGLDVHKAISGVVEKEGKMSSKAATEYVKALQAKGRYVQELWAA
jgi:NADPH-ferrihemoprotein reductase